MAVLNNTSDGFAYVLYILSKYIIKNGPTSRENLEDIFTIGIEDNNNSVRKTLTRWIELDLFDETKDGIFFSNTSLKLFKKVDLAAPDAISFRRTVASRAPASVGATSPEPQLQARRVVA